MNAATQIQKLPANRLRRFFVREDPVFDQFVAIGQAKSRSAKVFYILMHLLPGITGWALINVELIYRAELRLTGLPGKDLQYAWLILICFGWHMLLPFLVLHFSDKQSWRECLGFLGLNRIDLRGLFLVLPVYCALFALVALPYMLWVWNPLEHWLQSVPAFQMPAHTIFKMGPDGLYSFPPVALLFLFVGNFLGEELYFRGYVLKKIAFLGNAAWIVNSILFALYHVWQIPQTWPLVGLALAFGLLMRLRKDLYVMIAFHLFVNMWLSFGAYPLAKLLTWPNDLKSTIPAGDFGPWNDVPDSSPVRLISLVAKSPMRSPRLVGAGNTHRPVPTN